MRAGFGGVAAAMLVGAALAGCQGKSQSAAAVVAPPPVAASAATLATSPAAAPSGVPRQVSLLPDGVYRSHVGSPLLTAQGADPTLAGTWTLTIKGGTYRLECAPTSDPGTDCGNDGSSSPETVEIGTVRGTGSTVWFVHDQALLSKINGCVVGSQADDGCGPDGGYHMTWVVHGQSLVLSDYVGLGDEADESPVEQQTVQPWTRIS